MLPEPMSAGDGVGIAGFVAAVERRREKLGLLGAWSIAELRPDEEDYARIGRWARALAAEEIREWSKDGWSWAGPPLGPGRTRLGCLGLLAGDLGRGRSSRGD